jgi:hypothetical protein
LHRLLAQGKRPAYSDQTDTVTGRAWNKVVAESGLVTTTSECCCWVVSGNNSVYPVSVRVRYEDLYYGVPRELRETGFDVRIHTEVEQVNS